ncbi:ABC transporter ATP-binding protein [Desulfoferrobacter suflitae]|uniref:ABC transporter ATP-binding protein n=1 Tax=Desulfoferrobacter suflitae TaxID=2865782 RepID=UPI002164E43B|nr:ABC transporter ATP-binding protein [Desulfoferrobacter suflitae]MCK8602052.1 ABC transporter ATP-binding protein/permease [Desulfoferrobacter suflitae]
MNRYRRLLKYTFQQWPLLLIILVLSICASAIAALQPWPMKILVDYALDGAALPETLQSLLEALTLQTSPALLVLSAALGSLGFYALNSLVDVALSWAWTAAGQNMVYGLAADLFRHLQRLSLLFHTRHGVGDSLSRLSGDTWCIYTATNQLLVSPMKNVLTLVVVTAVAWHLDRQLALLSLAMAPLLGWSALFFGRRLKIRTRNNREAESRLLSFVHQTMSAIPVVQAFTAERRNGRRFRELATSAVGLSQRGILVKNSFEFANEFILTVGTAIVLFAAGKRVLSGALTLGSLLIFLAYLRSLQGACRGLLGIYGGVRSVSANIDRVLEILETQEGVWDLPGARAVVWPGRGVAVAFDGVTFGYEAGRPILQEITLAVRPGETVALVGATGAGKSTLVSLIPRFFDPWEGRILFNGLDIREVTLSSLRSQVSLVLQEPFLLPLSIAENIAYGRPGASREEMVAAARAANAEEFIGRLPQGYETVLGERGASLSGGERQRLSIARALLKDAPVVLLDEPTSSLDAGTEALLLEALERLMEGRTTFIIAHRLSTIRGADRILVMDRGRIVESGTHEELLAARGAYFRLDACQAAKKPLELVA